jgi:hypothetical protein
MVNNIGFGDNLRGVLTNTNSTNKSAPPVRVSSTPVNLTTAGGPSVLPKDKPDGFFTSNILSTNSGLMGDWSNSGAAPAPAEKTNEITISSFPNTKKLSDLTTFRAVPNNPQVQGVLVAAVNTGGPDAPRIAGITVS